MMRSMYSGVSGLRVHQTKMDVIGNNIANVNTVGFKTQRVTFSEVFSQTLQSSTAPNDQTGKGGINAMQVGLGVGISSIDTLMTQGAAQRTDNPFDLMINGDGFIVVGDATGTYFTRAGALRQDNDGNLVIPNGMKVQGWGTTENDEGKVVIQKGEVKNLQLGGPENSTAPPETTTLAEIAGNLDKDAETMPIPVNQKVYDSLGNAYTFTYAFNYIEDGVDPDTNEPLAPYWEVSIPTESVGNPATDMVILKDENNNEIAVPPFFNVTTDTDGNVESTPLTLRFDTNGKMELDTNQATGSKEKKVMLNQIDLSQALDPETGEAKMIKAMIGTGKGIEVNLEGLTQFASSSTVESETINGKPSGTIMGFDVAADGKISAYYDNGSTRLLGQIVVAQFENPTGLERYGDNLFRETSNSGEFDKIGTDGSFQAGVLEMSNVDLSSEFTEMITTQRGFQANSRIISVSDEMLQELVNLK